jgi:hypothetical protein
VEREPVTDANMADAEPAPGTREEENRVILRDGRQVVARPHRSSEFLHEPGTDEATVSENVRKATATGVAGSHRWLSVRRQGLAEEGMQMSSAVNPPNDDDSTVGRDRPAVGAAGDRAPLDRREIVARQKEQFGGMKFGAAFFGWLAATGMAVLLTALVAGAGTALGLGRNVNTTAPTAGDVRTVGIVGGIVLLVIVFIAYLCGGYVAGRMARFSGVRQGVAVWLWAVVIAIIVAILSAVAGARFDVLANLNGFPRIPINEGTLTTAGVVTAIALALASLIGAILGGLIGMRFHRRVDKVSLT